MKHMLKSLLLTLCVLIGLVGTDAAAQSVRVFDQANLLTPAQIADLEKKIATFRDAYALDLAVVTTAKTDGKTSRAYADDFYDTNDFGTGPEKNGFLLLIDMKNRQIYISTAGSAIRTFTDRRIDAILDRQYPSVKSGDYYGAFAVAIETAATMLDTDKNAVFRRFLASIAIGISTALIATVVVSLRYRRPFRPVDLNERLVCSMTLTQHSDTFRDTRTTSRTIERKSSGSGGGGGSSTHTSSSGRTHGGGGRSF